MLIVYVLIWGSMLLFGTLTVWALAWAIRHGEFSDFQAAAASIFDDQEPQGAITDVFPDQRKATEEQLWRR